MFQKRYQILSRIFFEISVFAHKQNIKIEIIFMNVKSFKRRFIIFEKRITSFSISVNISQIGQRVF